MNQEDLTSLIESRMGIEPNLGQHELAGSLAAFVLDTDDPRGVFVVNGYAGTGKTTVIGALVRALAECKVKTVVLAPTGRAAKVASLMARTPASTIHRRIYHPVGEGPATKVALSPNKLKDAVFIVDEASLITDSGDDASLLAHLIRHVYTPEAGCRMILVGDTAQLPPVGQSFSPAMNLSRLRAYGLNPAAALLDQTVRQGRDSGILFNATLVRNCIVQYRREQRDAKKASDVFSSPFFVNAPKNLPKLEPPKVDIIIPELDLRGFDDIEVISSNELADELSSSWSKVGAEETLIITRSNRRANQFNQAIRNQVMYAEEPLQSGDRIVVSRNDYYWKGRNSQKGFISNGEIAVVNWVGRREKMYGRWFVDAELYFPADGSTMGVKLMLRSLVAEGPSIPPSEMDRFFQHVVTQQEGVASEKVMAAVNDPYYNAIQAKYAYCVTCHKAQGGQWKHVYVDMAGIAQEKMDIDFLRWLYTAMTRATERLCLINPTLPFRM